MKFELHIENEKAGQWPKSISVFTDGASRGNPGPASIGIFCIDETQSEILAEIGASLGTETNNVAEYTAVLEGLRYSLAKGVENIKVKSDSQLLIRQLLGQYKVKAPGLKPLYSDCRALIQKFKNVELIHVPREQNKVADRLANEALDRL